jgi:hypothetical protein
LQRSEDLARQSTATEAMETEFEPISVSVRTFLAAAKALCKQVFQLPATVPAARATAKASFTWPRICGSPTTIESRLAATRKRWRTASWSRCS